jgi:hypothetical protein
MEVVYGFRVISGSVKPESLFRLDDVAEDLP